jgi:hypothetical protein
VFLLVINPTVVEGRGGGVNAGIVRANVSRVLEFAGEGWGQEKKKEKEREEKAKRTREGETDRRVES